VKTDRRDAVHEALRDLARARKSAKRNKLRAKHRLGKFLLRQGHCPPEGMRSFTGPAIKHDAKRHKKPVTAKAFCKAIT
jgi:hypothetical protein